MLLSLFPAELGFGFSEVPQESLILLSEIFHSSGGEFLLAVKRRKQTAGAAFERRIGTKSDNSIRQGYCYIRTHAQQEQ